MAIYNEILAGRFSRSFQKIFSMKGQNPGKQLSGEVMPTHQLGSGVENRFCESWYRYGTAVNVAAVAANNSAVRLRNPAASGMIAVMENISVLVGSAMTMDFDISKVSLDLTNLGVSQRLDPRGGSSAGGPFSTLILSNQAVAGLSPTIFKIAAPTTGPCLVIQNENQEWPILPGDALTIFGDTVNVAISVGVIWRERPLEESERF